MEVQTIHAITRNWIGIADHIVRRCFVIQFYAKLTAKSHRLADEKAVLLTNDKLDYGRPSLERYNPIAEGVRWRNLKMLTRSGCY